MWDGQKGGVHVSRVCQICCMLQGLCEPCRCVMIWACDCMYVMCACFG